jgi:hypothetical protein
VEMSGRSEVDGMVLLLLLMVVLTKADRLVVG